MKRLAIGAVAFGLVGLFALAACAEEEEAGERPTTGTATATVEETEAPLAPASPDFGAFANGWSRHGFGMAIDTSGEATASWRVYKWCSDDPTPPCDDMVGNQIISGGRATIIFGSVDGATAYGWVKESNDESFLRDGLPVSLTLLPYGMALLEHISYSVERGFRSESTVLCGPDMEMPDWLREKSPCGA